MFIGYLQSAEYPEGYSKVEKRGLRKKSEPFHLRGDELIHLSSKGKETVVVEDQVRRLEIMTTMHAGVIGGCHYGQNATITKVTDRFWWPSVSADVRAHVRSCLPCQKSNPLNRPPASTLHPLVVHHLFHRWGIDLVGPLQTTPQGNKYVVVATEYLKKWVEAKAIPDKSAEQVHAFLLDLVFRYGSMNVILHDQGRYVNC